MRALYGDRYAVPRSALVCLGVAVACYLVGATLSQAILATGRAWIAAVAWLAIGAGFVAAFVVLQGDELARVSEALALATGVGVVGLGLALSTALRG